MHLVNSRAKSSHSGQSHSQTWSESGLGVTVCLSLFWALGSLPTPSADVSVGLQASGLRPVGASHLPSLLSERTVSYLSQSQGLTVKGSDSIYFLSREVALVCGNHQIEGDEFSCAP